MDDAIKKASNIVADDLTNLLLSQMRINVKGQAYKVSEEAQKRLPAPPEHLLLTGPEEITLSDDNDNKEK
jgi:hypothetical protein